MKIRRRILFSLFWFLLLLVVPFIQASARLSTTYEEEGSELPLPLKVYHLTVLPEVSEQRVKLNPPAAKVAIAIQPGDVAIRCGYNFNIYTCVSGKTLKIHAEPDRPIQEFWVQNPLSHNVRISITVYENY